MIAYILIACQIMWGVAILAFGVLGLTKWMEGDPYRVVIFSLYYVIVFSAQTDYHIAFRYLLSAMAPYFTPLQVTVTKTLMWVWAVVFYTYMAGWCFAFCWFFVAEDFTVAHAIHCYLRGDGICMPFYIHTLTVGGFAMLVVSYVMIFASLVYSIYLVTRFIRERNLSQT